MTEELKGEELDSILDDLQRRMDRLRVLYEQHFLGIEKVPPYQVQKDVVRILYRLQQAKLKGTSQKFRFQALIQKFSAHKAYWQRTMREIEEGTYKRQAFRAEERKKRMQRPQTNLTSADYQAIQMVKDQKGEEAAVEAEAARAQAADVEAAAKRARAAAVEDEASRFMASMGVEVTPPASAGAKKPAPDIRGMTADEVVRKRAMLEELRNRVRAGAVSAPGGPGRAEPDADRALYDRFVAERRRLNEPVDALSFDAVKKSLDAQRDRVREKHGVRRVEFEVVEKDGRAFMKPIPIKD